MVVYICQGCGQVEHTHNFPDAFDGKGYCAVTHRREVMTFVMVQGQGVLTLHAGGIQSAR